MEKEILKKLEKAWLLSNQRSISGLAIITGMKLARKISSRQQHELAYELGRSTMAQALREVFSMR